MTKSLKYVVLGLSLLGVSFCNNAFWIFSRVDAPYTVTLATPTKALYSSIIYPGHATHFSLTNPTPSVHVSLQPYHGLVAKQFEKETRSFSLFDRLKTMHQQTTPSFLSIFTSSTIVPASYEPNKTVTDAYTLVLGGSGVKLYGPLVKKAAAIRLRQSMNLRPLRSNNA